MEEAKRLEYISRNPLDNIKDYKIESNEKQYLPHVKVKKLFADGALTTIWDEDLKMFTLNLLAATTGLRMGECQALRSSDINLNSEILTISRSWGRQYGFKSPKTINSMRSVPFPHKTATYLKQLIDEIPKGDSEALIFANRNDRHIPVDHKTILKKFYNALQVIGISDEVRKELNISFHSWRHFFVSKVRPHVSETLIRSVIGHSNKSVTDQYTHQLDLEDYEPIRKAQEKLV
jgi:integrase